ncbi:MAG TPA: aminoglycoside phosphotransferase family protein [Roseiflexaceae bacterium]|nr:aminoglycoside phosphotransferase family protein [Roseiflexaceae bacterium]
MSDKKIGHTPPNPPPASGVRVPWSAVPARVRSAAEQWLGARVVEAISQPGGFSPGAASRLLLSDGRRAFAKAISSDANPQAPAIYRREAKIAGALPPWAPAPRLLWSLDEGEGGWVVLLFEDVAGRQPAQPWLPAQLEQVLAALVNLGTALTPSPLPPALVGTASEAFTRHVRGWHLLHKDQLSALDPWAASHLERLIALEQQSPAAVAGDTLLHFDVRADNVLMTNDQVWFVDWPHACVGAVWLDAVLLAPSVTMQGGPPPEQVLDKHPAAAGVDPDAITAAIVGFAGYLTQRSLLPAPPGLPTLRAFQAAQGAVARAWVAQRLAD